MNTYAQQACKHASIVPIVSAGSWWLLLWVVWSSLPTSCGHRTTRKLAHACTNGSYTQTVHMANSIYWSYDYKFNSKNMSNINKSHYLYILSHNWLKLQSSSFLACNSRLRSAIRRHHPPQRAVLSQICCFGERKMVMFQILLDGDEPRDAGTT